MDVFFIKIAGLTVKVSANYPLPAKLCRDYICEPSEDPDITVSYTLEQLNSELEKADEPVSPEYNEFLCIYRSIAEQLPRFGAFVFHGAAISYKDRGYLFTAQSGTGKSTHIRLWREHIGKAVDIINGDKPIIRIAEDGVFVCSTPWAGKEGWQKNRTLPLGAVVFLGRSKTPYITKKTPALSIPQIMNQVYMPKNADSLACTLELIDKLLTSVPLFELGCDISESSVKVAFEAVTGEKYNGKAN